MNRGMDKMFDCDFEALASYQVKVFSDVIYKLMKEKRNASNALRKSEKKKRQLTIKSSFQSYKPSENIQVISAGKGFLQIETVADLIAGKLDISQIQT